MKLIIGNWKMYPATLAEAKKIVVAVAKKSSKLSRVKAVVCPPAIFIERAIQWRGRTPLAVGAQSCFALPEGAYTGEVSPRALASLGATHVIVGHSERRAMGESDAEVAKKISAVALQKLTAVLCVGEKARDAHGTHFGEVSAQLRASLAGFPKREAKRLVIAYEPIWAIGVHAKKPATPSDHREMSILIRRALTEYFGKRVAFTIPILYGGSVDEENATGFLEAGGADGLLVGRVSLHPDRFSAILDVADHLRKK